LIESGGVKIEGIPRENLKAEAWTAPDSTMHLATAKLSSDAVMPAVLHEASRSGVQGGARAVYDRAFESRACGGEERAERALLPLASGAIAVDNCS
jgi:hypothetical protein